MNSLPSTGSLSVVIPAYNEETTLPEVVERVLVVPHCWKLSSSMTAHGTARRGCANN